jgi:futalosine hydrolase
MRVLVVTAVAVEAESVAAGLTRFNGREAPLLPGDYVLTGHTGGASRVPTVHAAVVDVLTGGVGPAAVAAATATALAVAGPYDLVISAGIGGGFQPRAPLGSLVVADAIVAADLGAETPDGYLPVDELGFGRSVHRPAAELSARMAGVLNADPELRAVLAPILTVSTVTGTAARAAELTARHPLAAAEGMEGFGVAEATAVHAVPFAEIRAISNTVGPRDRAQWQIGRALDSLRYAFTLLTTVFEEPT